MSPFNITSNTCVIKANLLLVSYHYMRQTKNKCAKYVNKLSLQCLHFFFFLSFLNKIAVQHHESLKWLHCR